MAIDETREIKVGIRIDIPPAGNGIGLFGHDEVNGLISNGWRVTEIKPGGAVITKTGQDEKTVSMVLSGGDFSVVLARSTVG